MVNTLFIVIEEHGMVCRSICISLGLKHRLHFLYEKSMVERTIEYLKDRTEFFDDYYPCMRTRICDLRYVYKWLILLFLCIIALRNLISNSVK